MGKNIMQQNTEINAATEQFAESIIKALTSKEVAQKAVDTLNNDKESVFKCLRHLLVVIAQSNEITKLKDVAKHFEIMPDDWRKEILQAKTEQGEKLNNVLGYKDGSLYTKAAWRKHNNIVEYLNSLQNPFGKMVITTEKKAKPQRTQEERFELMLKALSTNVNSILNENCTDDVQDVANVAQLLAELERQAMKVAGRLKEQRKATEQAAEQEQETAVAKKPTTRKAKA